MVVVSKWDDNGCGLQVGWQWLWSPSGMAMVVVSKWDGNGCGLQVGWQGLWSPSGMAMVVVSKWDGNGCGLFCSLHFASDVLCAVQREYIK